MKRVFLMSPLAAIMIAMFLAGCTPDKHADDTAGSVQPDRADRAAAPPSQALDFCQLMPLADVAGILQAHGAGTVTELKSHVGGACSYLHRTPHGYPVKLLIDLSRMRSTDQARQALAAHRQDFISNGTGVTPVPGLGEEAFVAEREGAEGLKLRAGVYQGQINLQLEDRNPATLRSAVLALGKTVLARLPQQ